MRLSKTEEKEYNRYLSCFLLFDFFRGKTFLITGSKGMLGRAIITFLVLLDRKHHLNLHIYGSTRTPENKPDYVDDADPITYIHFGKEEEETRSLRIDFIIHAASPTTRDAFKTQPVETVRTIIDETEKILDIARKGMPSVVYLSSIEVYGNHDGHDPLPESFVAPIDSLDWRSCYPLGKKAAEYLCYSYFLEYGINVKVARLGLVQGLTQSFDYNRIYSSLLKCICQKQDLTLNSDGSTMRSMIYTLDAVTGILYLLVKGKSGEAYNVSNPENNFTIKELCTRLFKKYDAENKVIFDIKPISETGFQKSTFVNMDISKILDLGWKPMTFVDDLYRIDIERFTEK